MAVDYGVINLVAIQAEMKLEDYLGPEPFRKKIFALAEEALAGLPQGPTLLAFPETIGLPLVVKAYWREGLSPLGLIKDHGRSLLEAALQYRTLGLRLLYLPEALAAYQTYKEVFSELSRAFKLISVAGSIFLPHIEEEASRGVHIASTRVYNTAFSFAASGRILGRSKKIYLTGQEARAGFSGGSLQALSALQTPLGKLGVAICLDAFYSSVIERLDGLGASIVVQPSANHAAWDRPWPKDPNLSEGQAWLRYGLREQIQGRENIVLGVNPMMVGNMGPLKAQGRSSIVANLRLMPDVHLEGYPGLLAIAEHADKQAFVRASIDH